MASNLRVDQILPTVGTNVAIGTATGTVTLAGTTSGTFSGNLTGNATGLSGSPTLSGITSVSTSNLTVNGSAYPSAGPLSNRNLVHNGAMTVSQRTTSSSSLTSGNNFILDRWRTYIQDIGTYTISQASDAPTGFRYSYKVDCTTADASPSAADDMTFYCNFEGQDFQHLKKGTASAESVTLSFWVKSNKTTTGQVNFRDQDNSRMISGTYTINSADTWEYKIITFAGDTSGALDNDNAASIQLQWYLDSGSNFTSGSINSSWGSDTAAKRNVNNFGLASSTDNYWQITGIQLEVGTVATPFEHRSFGDELARCQRYYETCYQQGLAPGSSTSQNNLLAVCPGNINRVYGHLQFQVKKRAAATVVFYSTSGASGKFRNASEGTDITMSPACSFGDSGVSYEASSGIIGVTNRIQGLYTAEAEI